MMRIFLTGNSSMGEDATRRVDLARTSGCDGVELDSQAAASPELVTSGISVSGISSRATFAGRASEAAPAAMEIRRSLQNARERGADYVTIPSPALAAGWSRQALSVAFGDWLAPLGDAAADAGIMLLVRNGGAFVSASAIWQLLDRLSHPALGCAWDVETGFRCGERPSVSVPVLNQKIGAVLVSDRLLALDPGESEFKDLVTFFDRLRGIGYGGWVGVSVDAGVAPESLVERVSRLRTMTMQREVKGRAKAMK